MKKIVIMPGGFHPFHAGHYALYKSAIEAFPDADVYVAATNDQSERPFPFGIKEKLAKLAGVAPGRFVQVKSPFQAKEITQNYNPEQDVLIFVRSEKDRNESPKPGGTKKDGSPAYFQPYTGKDMQPFSKHAYFAYLPTVTFGPGIQSATEIRKAWPTLDDRRKTAMVMSLYPATQKNPKLAQNVVQLLDVGMGGQVSEDISRRGFLKGMGAAAAIGASGETFAAPFNHGEYKDQMTGKSKGRYSTVKADNGNAVLTLKWPGSGQARIDIDLPGKIINFGARGSAGARVKVGNGPVIETYVNRGESGDYSWGAILDTNLVRKILAHSGELKIEVNIFRTGPEVFKFTIEQDAITKQFTKTDDVRKEKSPEPSAGYIARVKSRISANIVNNPDLQRLGEEGNTTVEIKMNNDGDILSQRIVKSSGFKRIDDAVLSAIQRTQVLPRDTDGRVPPTIKLNFEIKTTAVNEGGQEAVAEGAPIVVAQSPIDVRNPKKAPQPYRNQGDIVPDTKPPSTEKRGVKGRPGQRPMPKYDESMSQNQDVFAPDIETQQLLRYAQQHYPNAQGKQQAFVKFVQRALQHSEEDDIEQDEKIEQLAKEIKQLDAKVRKVAESADYLEEK